MLTPKQEHAVLWALRWEWERANRVHFGERLEPPILALNDHETTLGRWSRTLRLMELSRPMLLRQPWGVVVEVLLHEMAHQYVAEVLGVEESPHGATFQQVCAERNIDARACGTPSATNLEDIKVLQKVEKLLALAGSTNQHEAELAMNKARQLMLRHNLELAQARSPLRYTFRILGPARGRTHEYERRLSLLLQDHFFVDVLWTNVFDVATARPASVLEACGTPENLAIAEYVYDFLVRTGAQLWLEHKRTHRLSSDRDRLSFLAGVIRGFHQKLAQDSATDAGEGLVWLGDPGLGEYFRRRHPNLRTVQRGGGRKGAAFHAGQAAGAKIVLHRAVERSQARGLALPATTKNRRS